MYHDACHKFTRTTSCTVTRYDICSLACRVYNRALSAENLYSAFMKTGISPYNRSVISKECTMPAEVFNVNESSDTVDKEMPDTDNFAEHVAECHNESMNAKSPSSMFASKLDSIQAKKRGTKKAPRNHIGKIVSGQQITEPEVYGKITELASEHNKSSKGGKKSASGKCVPDKFAEKSSEKLAQSKKGKGKTSKAKKCKVVRNKENEPCPSHINLENESTDDDSETDITHEEKFCVCKMFTPDEVRFSVSVIFTKWVKCDNIGCPHWAHLKYCTDKTVMRSGDIFYCEHCQTDREE